MTASLPVEAATSQAKPQSSYPIAEVFTSPEGEGAWTGTSLCFLRLAGCNVGRPISQTVKDEFNATAAPFQIIKAYQEECTAWNGFGFVCDTNYRVAYRKSIDFILSDPHVAKAKRICLTGGEPLIHNLEPLIVALLNAGKKIHIETSGTKSLRSLVTLRKDWLDSKMKPRVGISAYVLRPSDFVWLTVSPKKNYLPESLELADEIKVLVDTSFDEPLFLTHFGNYIDSEKLWIQPVNDENTIRTDNLKRCLELQQKYCGLRLSTQSHKSWGVR